MKILIAVDKFKGSLTAQEVCLTIKQGILQRIPNAQVEMLPLADGGEGTLEILRELMDLDKIELTVNDPYFRPIQTWYGMNRDQAYIEMALASGLQLLAKEERSPSLTSTYGTGELIGHAVQNGAKKIHLFVGGSATIDGGVGISSALGFKFLNRNREKIIPIGKNLNQIDAIEHDIFTNDFHLNLITDVRNPLLGPNGASHQYGPQKGATLAEIRILDKSLTKVANIVKDKFGQDVTNILGCGAGGGIGLTILGLMNGSIQNGINMVLEAVKFKDKLKKVDLVITGEGKIDEQTLQGKVVFGVAQMAQENNVSGIGICGVNELSVEEMKRLGLTDIISIKTPELSLDYCIENASQLIIDRIKKMISCLNFD